MMTTTYTLKKDTDPDYTFYIMRENFPSKYNNIVDPDWLSNDYYRDYQVYINKQLCDDGISRWHLIPCAFSDNDQRYYDTVFIDGDVAIDTLCNVHTNNGDIFNDYGKAF